VEEERIINEKQLKKQQELRGVEMYADEHRFSTTRTSAAEVCK
jgi:hypothetical protein